MGAVENLEGFSVKSVMILAALCAALCVSVPAAQAKGMTDKEIYCTFMPMAKMCAPAAAKPAMAKPAMAKPAMAKPAPKKVAAAKPAPVGIKMLACVKAEPGKGHLYSCKWK